jgi:hypothetical protein
MAHIGRRFVPQSTIDRRVQAKDDRYARELRARFPQILQPEAVPYASVELHRADGTVEALLARKTDSAPAVVLCAWCPDFTGVDPIHRGASHGMCPSCAALFDAAIDADRANGDDRDDDRQGEACTAACGHCGRCS